MHSAIDSLFVHSLATENATTRREPRVSRHGTEREKEREKKSERPAFFQGRALIRELFLARFDQGLGATTAREQSWAFQTAEEEKKIATTTTTKTTCGLGSVILEKRKARVPREEIRDHWEDREGGETDARHSLLARQHSDLSIDFHDRSRTGESERTQRTNGRGTKGERGTQPPRISVARHEFQTGLRAQFTCLRAVSKKGCERGVDYGGDTIGKCRPTG